MGIRVAKICAGQGAVHAPVVIDSVHRFDPQQFHAVEQNKEAQEKQPLCKGER